MEILNFILSIMAILIGVVNSLILLRNSFKDKPIIVISKERSPYGQLTPTKHGQCGIKSKNKK